VESGNFIAVARIVKTRGIRGEVLAEIHSDFPARFQYLREVWLEWPDRGRFLVTLENSWEHKGRQVLKVSGIDSVEEAERLVGAWVEVESRHAVALPEGAYFDHDLIGCVLRTPSGEPVGIVKEIMRIAGNHQLVVEGKHGNYLVPASAGICKEVSVERKEILVDLPEGLMDLNP
jgi:16S rRNA processing protein RimM